MWGLVESGSITKLINKPRGMVIGDTRHSRKIFELWSKAELEAKGIYEVEFDNTNKKDEQWYINTDQSFAFAGGKITASYGSATAKAHADTLYTQEEEDDGEGTKDDVKTEGLKTVLIRQVKAQAEGILNKTDWYVTRKAEKSTAIPSAITTHRDAVRTKQASMETAITNASDTPALETLYTFTKQEDGSFTRPLGVLPTL